MLPEQQTPLVLTAMTLRGIGSYLHGARLELRPLTVLCGKNGSGKSTWLKVLNLLSESLEAGRLPFGYVVNDWEPDNIQILNAFYHLADPEEHARFADAKATGDYGPPGTIGLQLQVIRDINLPMSKALDFQPQGKPQEFLWAGNCRMGTRFRLRFAHPSYYDDSTPTPELFHLVELEMDGQYLISMNGERDPLQRFEEGHSRPRRTKPYELSCSGAFLPGHAPDAEDALVLANVTDLVHLNCETHREDCPPGLVSEIVKVFETRIRQLLEIVLNGYFYLGAIRQPHTKLSVGDYQQVQQVQEHPRRGPVEADGSTRDRDAVLRRRHVGIVGEHAWLLERYFAGDEMRPVILGYLSPEDMNGSNCLRLLSEESRSADAKLSHLWDLADSTCKEQLCGLDVDTAEESVAAEYASRLMNSLLGCRDLFQHSCWLEERDVSESSYEEPYWQRVPVVNDVEVNCFYKRSYHTECEYEYDYDEAKLADLSSPELLRLNRLLVEHALCQDSDSGKWGLRHRSVYSLEQYVSGWMKDLTESGINKELYQTKEILKSLEGIFHQWRSDRPGGSGGL